MKSNRHFVMFVVCWSLVMVIPTLLSPALAAEGCYKHITFKNESAYIANGKVFYKLDNHSMSQDTGNFPTGQDRRVPVPCSATSVGASAHAVGGHDIFGKDIGNAQDRCFKLKGTTFNPHYESCDPQGTPPIEVSNCYKHITFKNRSGYIAHASVRYTYNKLSSTHHTGNFPAGQSKRVAIPCDATSLNMVAKAVGGFDIFGAFSYATKVEDRCIAFKGTSLDPYFESCDPSETLPPIDCWKHITLKNESGYVVNVVITYWIGDRRIDASTGGFPHGKVKQIAVPCSSSSRMHPQVVGGLSYLLPQDLNKNQDYCFIFKGLSGNARYEPCLQEQKQVAPEQRHNIIIRNHGAYATELTIHYDLNYERKSTKKVIQTQQHGGVSIPLEAKNVQVTAKAIGGKQIFETIFPTAQSYCRAVGGTTLIPNHRPCN